MKIAICFSDATDEQINEMLDYCHDNNLLLEKFENTDVSDVSLHYDMVSTFTFKDKDEALFFKLKYAGN